MSRKIDPVDLFGHISSAHSLLYTISPQTNVLGDIVYNVCFLTILNNILFFKNSFLLIALFFLKWFFKKRDMQIKFEF